MRRSVYGRAGLVLVVAVILGFAATNSTSAAEAATVAWPVGLLTGAAIMLGRLGGALILTVGSALVFATHVSIGFSWSETVVVGIAHLVGAGAAIAVITRLGSRRAQMFSEADVARYALAALAGGVLAGAAMGVCSWATSAERAGVLALGLGLHHLASQLVMMPWFVSKRSHPAPGGLLEQTLQWTSVLVATTLIFAWQQGAALAFVVITLLAWGALRLGTYAILAQLFVVVSIASALTLRGVGPFVDDGFLGRGDDAPAFLLRLFIISCALVVVPLVMTVGLQLDAVRRASLERDRAERIIASAESIVIIGGDLEQITYFSPGAERLLGYPADEVVGRRIRLMTDAEVERLGGQLGVHGFDAICHALMDREGTHELRLRRRDGVERTHLASLRTVSHDGHVEYVLISDDITARREEQAAQLAAIERLREIDLAKDTFVGGVSHELRTPLTTMTGFLEMLADGSVGPLTEQQSGVLARVAANNQRLLTLVDDLLTFARLGSGEVVAERVALDLRDVVGSACDLVEPTWSGRGQTTVIVLPERPVVLHGDATLLERVVVNLVGNAVKFTPEGGRIDVTLVEDGAQAVLAVSDTGIGIPADELDRLFSRFFRSRLARDRAVRGSGLGLSIAKAVVDAHDGAIGVESVEGKGTTVTARFPLVRVAETAPVDAPVTATEPVLDQTPAAAR